MLKKHFWATYVNDSERFVFVFGLMLVIVGVWTAIAGHIPWPFIVGYTLMDPFSYHMTGYKRVLREEALTHKNSPPKTP